MLCTDESSYIPGEGVVHTTVITLRAFWCLWQGSEVMILAIPRVVWMRSPHMHYVLP